ncbi:hypothetical protein GCM10028778_08660 [Barrientosiimonas marina]|uniref:RNA polymerase subunit sigma-70 n=1 Tax=Lentibacillus kimchii TaxID=1542911 RepID=A0ABW2UY38_9BACI
MRFQDKQSRSNVSNDIYGVDFHRFMEIEDSFQHMEISEELGISLGAVQRLRKKVTRT